MKYLMITHRVTQKSSTISRLRKENPSFRFLDYQNENDQAELFGREFSDN